MRRLATLGLMAAAIVHTSPVAAADPPKADPPKAPDAAESGPKMEVYGALLPFFEYVGTSGATPQGTVSTAPNVVGNGQISGRNHERRFRMTSGTSHIGFRGDLPIAGEDLKLIWQVESPAPIDGEGPATWASRNTHVGFATFLGTVVYGNWDTPMKVVTATSVNPIKGGYIADHVPIIGSPGASVAAINTDPWLLAAWELIPNRAGFFRHEVNTVQYWTPNVFGFSGRVMYAANEHRLDGNPVNGDPAVNPFLVSGYIGYDNSFLRLRYSAELHNDYFGTGNLGSPPDGPNTPSSQDVGHLGLAMVTINGSTDYKTRIVLVGDYLKYHTDDRTTNGTGLISDISRIGAYALIQQTFGKHNFWVAGGHATEGQCDTRPDPTCPTVGLSADYGTVGYLYSIGKDSGVFLIGYGLWNDIMARYTPFPILDLRKSSATTGASGFSFLPNLGEISHGADTTAVGLGFVHVFNVPVLGGAEPAPAKKAEPPPPEKKEAPPPPAKPEGEPEKVDLKDEKAEEAPPPAP